MKNYFICNGIDSRDLDIHIEELPAIKSPAQRINKIIIPGKSGTLTELEGENIYDSYYRPFEIIALNENRISDIKNLLKGKCKIIFSNELEFSYDCFFSEEIEFIRTFKNWRRATLNPEFQPFKEKNTMVYKKKYIHETNRIFEITVDTDVPCPFIADFYINDGSIGWMLFDENKILCNYHHPNFKPYNIIVNNFLGTISDNENKNLMPYCQIYSNNKDDSIYQANFPFLLKKGKNIIRSGFPSELKLTYQGRFL